MPKDLGQFIFNGVIFESFDSPPTGEAYTRYLLGTDMAHVEVTRLSPNDPDRGPNARFVALLFDSDCNVILQASGGTRPAALKNLLAVLRIAAIAYDELQ